MVTFHKSIKILKSNIEHNIDSLDYIALAVITNQNIHTFTEFEINKSEQNILINLGLYYHESLSDYRYYLIEIIE